MSIWADDSPMDIWAKSFREAEERNAATKELERKLNLVKSRASTASSSLDNLAQQMTSCCCEKPDPKLFFVDGWEGAYDFIVPDWADAILLRDQNSDTTYLKYKNGRIDIISKEDNTMNTMNNMTNDLMNNVYNGVFGRVAPDLCRISMGGNIAIKTKSGYKSYNVKTGRLTNCSSFAFNIGDEAFFVLPTSHVEEGDIIMVGGYPHCVISTSKNRIEAFCYEDSSVHTIVPEHHVFMGKSYLYGKIVSMFGDIGKSNGMKKMMHFMMLSQMMNRSGSGNGGSGAMDMLPMMMLMGGGSGSILDGMFDFDEGEDEAEENADSEEEA